MDTMTLDLFSEDPAPQTSPPPPAPLPPAAHLTPPSKPRSDAKRLEAVLEQAFVEAGRKGALKSLDEVLRSRLLSAVEVVSRHKRDAYELARQGVMLDSFGWVMESPELAQATSDLHGSMLSSASIPMAPNAPV